MDHFRDHNYSQCNNGHFVDNPEECDEKFSAGLAQHASADCTLVESTIADRTSADFVPQNLLSDGHLPTEYSADLSDSTELLRESSTGRTSQANCAYVILQGIVYPLTFPCIKKNFSTAKFTICSSEESVYSTFL
jgi:hypothetical protein